MIILSYVNQMEHLVMTFFISLLHTFKLRFITILIYSINVIPYIFRHTVDTSLLHLVVVH